MLPAEPRVQRHSSVAPAAGGDAGSTLDEICGVCGRPSARDPCSTACADLFFFRRAMELDDALERRLEESAASGVRTRFDAALDVPWAPDPMVLRSYAEEDPDHETQNDFRGSESRHTFRSFCERCKATFPAKNRGAALRKLRAHQKTCQPF